MPRLCSFLSAYQRQARLLRGIRDGSRVETIWSCSGWPALRFDGSMKLLSFHVARAQHPLDSSKITIGVTSYYSMFFLILDSRTGEQLQAASITGTSFKRPVLRLTESHRFFYTVEARVLHAIDTATLEIKRIPLKLPEGGWLSVTAALADEGMFVISYCQERRIYFAAHDFSSGALLWESEQRGYGRIVDSNDAFFVLRKDHAYPEKHWELFETRTGKLLHHTAPDTLALEIVSPKQVRTDFQLYSAWDKSVYLDPLTRVETPCHSTLQPLSEVGFGPVAAFQTPDDSLTLWTKGAVPERLVSLPGVLATSTLGGMDFNFDFFLWNFASITKISISKARGERNGRQTNGSLRLPAEWLPVYNILTKYSYILPS